MTKFKITTVSKKESICDKCIHQHKYKELDPLSHYSWIPWKVECRENKPLNRESCSKFESK